MLRYVLKRIGTGILTVLVVFVINFIIIHATPGDPINYLMGKDNHDEELRIELEEKYGLNQPLAVQFVNYLKTAATGDLGNSIIYDRPVTDMIGEKVGATLLLGLVSGILALLLGTVMGIHAARHEGRLTDWLFSGFSYIMNSVPSFWLGLMLIIVFASGLGWLPSYGMSTVRVNYTGWAYIRDILIHLILPAVTLTAILIPQYFRIAKSSVLQVTNEEFVLSLRATGMSEKKIFYKYIFRNAILPTVTIFGISMAYLITGVTLIETVFAWPGMGTLVLTAINQRDYPTLMGIYLVMAISIAVVMLVVDLVYALLDPRIRYQ
ncbi:MAG: ABC transporter permease [Eubacteriales bacterium]|nr:ABC transporter permease [Eubacteriales bacterium]